MDDKLDLIVSFATYAPRLKHDNVKKMLQSILKQRTNLRYKIVMNITKEDVQCVSEGLNKFLIDNNIEINVVESNLYSHNKYFYVMQKYREFPIITVDDDIQYSENLIDGLYQSYVKYPDSIHTARCHLMTFNENGQLNFYNNWKWEYKDIDQPSKYLFATTGAGTLFPPNCLNVTSDILCLIDKFKTSDDFLIKYILLQKNIKVCYVRDIRYVFLKIPNDTKLMTINISARKNDEYIKMINQFFTKEEKDFSDTHMTSKSICLDDLEKYSFVISINDERFDLFNRLFKYHGLKNVKKYDGFQLSNIHGTKIQPHVNCQFSHLALIKMAKLLNWPFVCIFEDDTYPCYDIKNKLEYYLTDIPIDCECLVLGNVEIRTSYCIKNKYLAGIRHVQGAHAYIVFNNAYEKIIKMYNTTDMHCDILLSRLKTYSPKYNLFIQYDQKPSMNNFNGYVWKNRTQEQIFKEFPPIENIFDKKIGFLENKNSNRFLKMIIPCYNCENTIRAMINSILEQTCKDFFIVLVDDMSTDNTFIILKEYEQKYPDYIKAVQVPKKMYADGAREFGYKQYNNAEFTWFIDGDDRLENENVVQKLKNIHQEKQLDLYTFNSNQHKFNLHNNLLLAPWFRIVKSNKIIFDVLNIKACDDVTQSFKQYDSIPDEKIYHINEVLYHYSCPHQTNRDIYVKYICESLDKYTFNKNYIRDIYIKKYKWFKRIS